MHCNVPIRECDVQVPNVCEEIGHDCAEGAIKLRALFGGGHEVDWNCVHGGLFRSVENESILLPLLDK